MADTLVDSNVLLDVLTEDARWFGWSSEALARRAGESTLVINPIIYAEVSIGFARIEDLDETLNAAGLERRPLPWEAGFLAGKCFQRYKRRGGVRTAALPDFYIGAHAAVDGLALLTRDAARYRTYFPGLEVVSP
ncbi:MAG: type II toxin-antitoxin system VapC family toxin [Thermoanaerobaculia bacterium]